MCKNKGDIMKLTDIKNASDSALFAEKGYDVFGFDREAVRARTMDSFWGGQYIPRFSCGSVTDTLR